MLMKIIYRFGYAYLKIIDLQNKKYFLVVCVK